MSSTTMDRTETLNHCVDQAQKKQAKVKAKYDADVYRVEKQTHAQNGSTVFGFSTEYSDKYEQIDWSK